MDNNFTKFFDSIVDCTCFLDRDRTETQLERADADFISYYNRYEEEWEIIIRSDVENKAVSLTYDRKGHFMNFVVMITNMDELLACVINSSFINQQFPHIKQHRGANLFPVSNFEKCKEDK